MGSEMCIRDRTVANCFEKELENALTTSSSYRLSRVSLLLLLSGGILKDDLRCDHSNSAILDAVVLFVMLSVIF